jgi:4-hydroxythreonine-4-phosphate dehydrogenase
VAETRPLAVSMGEPAGIGPDLILRLYAERATLGLPPFLVYGHLDFLRSRAERLNLKLAITAARPESAREIFAAALPVVSLEGLVADRPGEVSQVSAQLVREAISEATKCVVGGLCRGIVTAPIHKGVLAKTGFPYPGHTEFIAALTAQNGQSRAPVMMLCHENLRVVPVTVHVPVSAVPSMITTDLILSTARTVARELRTRFGIASPRIGVTGLNPHAGEGGHIGTEDLDVIAPAIVGLQQEGLYVRGPFPADTMFHLPHWKRYDVVLAMYHDQALIPIKTVAFDEAVNVTLGLNIVRTSPDHGTAFDLAGTGKGSTASMLAAIRLADQLTRGN